MTATKKMADYVGKMGISIKAISKKTGLSTNILYRSLGNGRGRELRVDEFLSICIFLDKDPMYFCCESQKDDEKKEQDQ